MERLTIGKNANNDWIIPQMQVSGVHAVIYYTADKKFVLEDQDSTNGTWVNGRRIKKAIIEDGSRVKLADVEINISELKQKFKIKSKDFTEEFAALEGVYNKFKQDVLDYKKKKGQKMLITRITFSLIPILILLIFSNSIGGNLRYALIGISPIIFMVFSFFSENNPEANKELEELQDKFHLDYVTPCCKKALGNSKWKVLAQQKKCPSCGAIWVK